MPPRTLTMNLGTATAIAEHDSLRPKLRLRLLLLQCLAISLLLLAVDSAPALDPSEASAMAELRRGLGTWANVTDTHPCSWPGIKCAGPHVTSLDLSFMNLSGTISPAAAAGIQLLQHLRVLNLSHNAFSGPFPGSVYGLRRLLVLDINHNGFSGELTPGISGLRSLVEFSAYSNNFTGHLAAELADLPALEVLNLGGSYFAGEIPPEFGNFRRLRHLHLAGNCLSGAIPAQLGGAAELQHLEIGYNEYWGGIPPELGNLSKLQYLDISRANLSGPLPPQLGKLKNLRTLLLFSNSLTGPIPAELSTLIWLVRLDLSQNSLSGPIPEGFRALKRLQLLHLMSNRLNGTIPRGLGELPRLQEFKVWNNSLTGELPQGLGRYSPLREVDVSSNNLSGPIPPGLCSAGKLVKLILFSNGLSGTIPAGLANCSMLYRLRIQDNALYGRIPRGFGGLSNLTFVDFSMNNLQHGITDDILEAPRLQLFNVSYNPGLGGGLPRQVWGSRVLNIFSAAHANISGGVPSFMNCSTVYEIELQGNQLSGSIPRDVSHCLKLVTLKLAGNRVSGTIPAELSTLPVITELDLSENHLSGGIPARFDNCSTLQLFNVSFNRLTGPVPSAGPLFGNINASALAGNPGLCGGALGTPCFEQTVDLPAPPVQARNGALAWVLGLICAVAVCAIMVTARCFYKQYKFRNGYRTERNEGPWKITAFQRLNFTVEDILECLKASNIIGMGSAGTVYKAEMPSGETIAVKKLWKSSAQSEVFSAKYPHRQRSRRHRGVVAEVDLLGNVRHRNIVRLLGCCSNNEGTLLLYEYMPNGSLADLLHGSSNKAANVLADWTTRHKIAVGVAQGLKYLHHDFYPVVVHRDVKPSNILLDADMEARVADFGVAKLIQRDESMSVIAGSYGYIAPEYAYTLQVDEKSDIYSFGVVLMEMCTGRRSVEAEFGEGMNIVEWVRSKVQAKDGVTDLLDPKVGGSATSSTVREEMLMVLRVALLCTSRCPADRPSMRDVVTMLCEAKPRRKAALAAHCLIHHQHHLGDAAAAAEDSVTVVSA